MKARVLALILCTQSIASARSPALGIAQVGASTFVWTQRELTMTRAGKSTRVKTRLPNITRVVAQNERSAFVLEEQTHHVQGGWISIA